MNIAYQILKVAAIISAIYIVIFNGIKLYKHFFPGYDEYVGKLSIVIWYNCDEQTVTADFGNYEKDQKIRITICSIKRYDEISPEEKELEGNEIYNERAVVRCVKGTHNPVAWWYLDQKS